MVEVLFAAVTLALIFCWRSACQSSVGECYSPRPYDQETGSATEGLLPEDSVLRRHFITQISKEIEAGLSPRPTDSVLLRHHEALLTMKLEQRLAEMGHLSSC